jgi:hypothetical protein
MAVRRRPGREQLLVARALLLAFDESMAPAVMAAELASISNGNEAAVLAALARLTPHPSGRASPVTQRAQAALRYALERFTPSPPSGHPDEAVAGEAPAWLGGIGGGMRRPADN